MNEVVKVTVLDVVTGPLPDVVDVGVVNELTPLVEAEVEAEVDPVPLVVEVEVLTLEVGLDPLVVLVVVMLLGVVEPPLDVVVVVVVVETLPVPVTIGMPFASRALRCRGSAMRRMLRTFARGPW